MRVAFLGDRLGLATGGNLYVARVAAELSRLGVEVTLITLEPPRDIVWDPALRVISQTIDLTFGRSPEKGQGFSFLQAKWAAVGELKKLVREPYDILYSVGGPSNIVNQLCRSGPFRPRASVAAVFHLFRQTSIPRFLLTADTYRKPFQTLYHSWGDHLARRFDAVVTVSRFWRAKLIERGFAADRVRVIPVGAETRDWPVVDPREAKKKLGLEDRLVVYTSPLRLNKGIFQVLQAAEDLANRFPQLLVLATGVTDRQTEEKVQRFLEVHNLEGHFRYDGVVARERLPYYHASAEVVVLASQEEEGWGIFLLEGMLTGKPVVCTPLGAMPELVGERGIVLAENTVPALGQALEQLFSSSELRERLGRAGRAFAASYSYEAAAKAHLELFEELIRK
ncbi:MAG: glycosyltransferase family 4 protein [Deltaproteobacteria bacterium]|nr:glycosyltransferase family 4 protein [Deltaproteobacteria bacterium]